ncbi:DUF930 domain-containing protein [Tianweitania sp. BSSL-BM11]|uniref:DUF930 domain-containing protein n=1 Tax=Tianweitania aestuarii TaxID=2814886 RepID=A0ABS5RWR4_9HYPH|nr:DUF930 domain-containing protein [Tianweitania aestuarii]MBS9721466.1 DUF930 domain-containing protein [Tianweitania aestuarii]
MIAWKKATLSVAAGLFLTTHSWALSDERLNTQLMRLDRQTRLEQTCDLEVLLLINREHKKLNVDKVIAYSFAEPIVGHNQIEAPGAVFRSKGEWYRLRYWCETGAKHLDAHKLRYEVGAAVPHGEWLKHNLYD